MNPVQKDNIEKVIDSLSQNLVWAWNYYHFLEGLHEEAKESNEQVERFPCIISCLWLAVFEALFVRMNHFIDRTKNVHSFFYLFKLIRCYLPENTELKSKISEHKNKLLKTADPIIEKIENWRNQAVAHLTPASIDEQFHEENVMHLKEIKNYLELSCEILNTYSCDILNRIDDTVSESLTQKKEIKSLFDSLRAEYSQTHKKTD